MNTEETTKYEIRTMQDIADAVTPQNADNFLKDFQQMIVMLLLVKEASQIKVEKGEATQEEARVGFPYFTWIDDDKGEYKATMASRETGEEIIIDFNPIIQELQESTGLGVPQGSPEDRSEAKPECGPAGTATPKESVICVEALEKEGWINNTWGWFTKGVISVRPGELQRVEILMGENAVVAAGVSSMQDLRTLEALINGPQQTI